ncbi:MAG TPA: hypothetical protein VGO62_06435 [Myxococcota bacterium]
MTAPFDARYAAALRARDPVGAMAVLARELGVVVDEDGVRIAALLVARLRFERVVQGSREAALRFEREPERFARAFRAYHEAMPATASDPVAEARAFLQYVSAR